MMSHPSYRRDLGRRTSNLLRQPRPTCSSTFIYSSCACFGIIYIFFFYSDLSATFVSSSSAKLKPIISSSDDILADTPFCTSLHGALATGATNNRTMIHAFVSNKGRFQFLHNVLLSMIQSNLPWKPLVLSIGSGLCPMLDNVTELSGHYVCVPYLERLFHQLQRDEPESVEQIEETMIQQEQQQQHDSFSDNSNNKDYDARFKDIDNTFQTWGSVEHKFLINSKLYALRDILLCGVDAFITDTDVAFTQDPRPYFDIPGVEGDIVAQNDTNEAMYGLNGGINSGFMYWKSTRENLELINDIIKVPPFWWIDQSRVNERMANHSTPHTLLDTTMFPNGHMYLSHREDLKDVVAFHANWNEKWEEKQEMLENMGLWYL